MPPKRTATPKKSARSAWDRPEPLALAALLVGLGLSALNLWLMTAQAGTLAGVRDSFIRLQRNYAVRKSAPAAPAPVEVAKSEREMPPPVLFSIVRFREGEEAALRMGLTEPLTAFYAETRWPLPLAAILIERKNASSRDVNVRLFFVDGSEQSYLWPSTRAKDGKWIPPCTAVPARSSADLPLCPAMFSAAYPDLVELTR